MGKPKYSRSATVHLINHEDDYRKAKGVREKTKRTDINPRGGLYPGR